MSPYKKSPKFSKFLRPLIPAFQGEGLRHENCALLGHYAASSGNSFADVSGQPIGSILKGPRRRELPPLAV